MRILRPIHFIAALLVCATASFAVHASEDQRYNQISLQAQASAEVTHDVMRVTLYHEAQGNDPAKLAAQITRVLNTATTAARQVPGVTVQSGNRVNYPVTTRENRRITAWRERAELHLESSDFAALATLTATLLEDMQMANRQFIISKASRTAHENTLIQAAIAAFRTRAQLVTESLGAQRYKLIRLELDDSGFQSIHRRQAREAAMFATSMSAAAEPQQIEAGTSEVSITAHGVIEVLD